MTWDRDLKDNPKCVYCDNYINVMIFGKHFCSENCRKTMETLGYEEE